MKQIIFFLILFSHITMAEDHFAKATFAGGCFWCLEPPYDSLEGVIETLSGYSGGDVHNPTYQTVSVGTTGHAEVLQITYDPKIVNYQTLLEIFWVNIDPTNSDGQFCDIGHQYRSAIFYHDDEQRQLAEQSHQRLSENKPFKEKIVTEISPLKNFYAAEDYHQNYYLKNPLRYKFYRHSCGRDKRLSELWGENKK